ncbi:ATP-binding protein [Pseudomonas gingeri]|uniref:ATP-binding protein n=1 Tax=Pseudomonas gingeri TaxID=117681 RepID=A0A7Y7X945_9PSED|nr:ATP-binding protein [Pseudomonas gingeri]NWB95482.1 ATP-binding protein [Pseudomonas gingeri]
MSSISTQSSSIRRTFGTLSQESAVDIENLMLRDQLGLTPTIDWDELLKSMRVLIVSEAGTGKTFECQAQHQQLWTGGSPAFFLELSDLAMSPFEDLLSHEEENRFHAWQTSQSDVATFFLDSIDELQLTVGSFKVALNKLSKKLQGNLDRVCIIITTRPIPVDQHLIRQYFPYQISIEAPASPSAELFAEVASGQGKQKDLENEVARAAELLIVRLLPLSDTQIREMAATQLVTDIDGFVASIREKNAQDFARRPQDLIELCADWRASRSIRTHREQVSQNIQVKLKARADRPDEISPARALEGASRLALAALLARKLTIRHNTDSDLEANPQSIALDPGRVLSDWSAQDIQILLERSIFGFANYGRVRFHHRSVVEYLAAYRLNNRLSAGMSLKAAKRLLFAETSHNIKVIKPSMRPVAGWLAQSNPSIFEEVRKREPEVLLSEGDPESLSPERRVEALQAFVSRYGDGGWRGLKIPSLQVSRFASQDLSSTVRGMLEQGIENTEVRELLLQLVAYAEMRDCSDLVYATATDPSVEDDERLTAIDALVQLADPRLSMLVQDMQEPSECWSESLIRGAIVELFPVYLGPEVMVQLLVSLPVAPNPENGRMGYLARTVRDANLSADELQRLFDAVSIQLNASMSWSEDWPHICVSCPDLVPLLAIAGLRLSTLGLATQEVVEGLVLSLAIASSLHLRGEHFKSITAMFASALSQIRAFVFFYEDNLQQRLKAKSEPWPRLYASNSSGAIYLNHAQDSEWIHAALADRQRSLDMRQLMLEASLTLVVDHSVEWASYVETLKPLVSDDPTLLARIDEALQPPTKSAQMVEYEKRDVEHKRVAERRVRDENQYWVDFWHQLIDDPEGVLDSPIGERTLEALSGIMEMAPGSSEVSSWNRRFLEQHFGISVTNHLHARMRTLWPTQCPTLPMDRPQDEIHVVQARWQLGLTALWADAEDPLWATKIDEAQARTAAHYIPLEYLGCPGWIEQLAKAFPDVVQSVLGRQLRWELEKVSGHGDYLNVLNVVKNSPPFVAQLFMVDLQNWLSIFIEPTQTEDSGPAIWERPKSVLAILMNQNVEGYRVALRDTVLEKLQVAAKPVFVHLWLSALFALDPEAATLELTRLLLQIVPAVEGPGVDLFSSVFGGRWNGWPFDLGFERFTVSQRVQLLRLAYQHVRPSDDLHREGSFTPTTRDDAQQARNTLLGAVLALTGPEAWAAKMKLVVDPLFAHFRDRLALLAKQKAAEEMDRSEMTEDEISLLDNIGEASPKTRDEMFVLMQDRLDDIDDLLLQDVSPREAWANITIEKLMRREIARRLKDTANGLYTIDQEGATADEKETDIRMRSTSGQEATIELKIGEQSWSGAVLRGTVRDQLLTKYMAADRCKTGCLVVTVASSRQWKHPDTSAMIDLEQLRALLKQEADQIMEEMGHEVRILVKVLDLRPRLDAASVTELSQDAP